MLASRAPSRLASGASLGPKAKTKGAKAKEKASQLEFLRESSSSTDRAQKAPVPQSTGNKSDSIRSSPRRTISTTPLTAGTNSLGRGTQLSQELLNENENVGDDDSTNDGDTEAVHESDIGAVDGVDDAVNNEPERYNDDVQDFLDDFSWQPGQQSVVTAPPHPETGTITVHPVVSDYTVHESWGKIDPDIILKLMADIQDSADFGSNDKAFFKSFSTWSKMTGPQVRVT